MKTEEDYSKQAHYLLFIDSSLHFHLRNHPEHNKGRPIFGFYKYRFDLKSSFLAGGEHYQLRHLYRSGIFLRLEFDPSITATVKEEFIEDLQLTFEGTGISIEKSN